MFLGVSVPEIVDPEKQPQLFVLLDSFDRYADAVWMYLAAATLVVLLVPSHGSAVVGLPLAAPAVLHQLLPRPDRAPAVR